MFTLVKNGHVYAPDEKGKKDVLLAAGKIAAIENIINIGTALKNVRMIDATGKYVVPGFIDPHVHIIGGGGEGGYLVILEKDSLTIETVIAKGNPMILHGEILKKGTFER